MVDASKEFVDVQDNRANLARINQVKRWAMGVK